MADETREQRVLRMCEEQEDFLQLEDGCWYFAPKGIGAMSPAVLRIIIDELERRNAP